MGPGSYKHDVSIGRHVEYNSSFGGKRTLRGIVTLKCTKGIPDKVGGNYNIGLAIYMSK